MSQAGGVFGVSLEELAKRGGTGEGNVPGLLKPMLHYLSERGANEALFQQAANTKELQDLRYHINKGGRVDYEANPKTELVASLFKVFLRELPEPLLTHSLYPRFLAAADINEEQKRTATLCELMAQLPKYHRILTELILKFLSRLCVCSDSAQLTPVFLAHTFTHIFLRPKNETIETMIQLPKAIHLTQLLIETGTALLFPARAAVETVVDDTNSTVLDSSTSISAPLDDDSMKSGPPSSPRSGVLKENGDRSHLEPSLSPCDATPPSNPPAAEPALSPRHLLERTSPRLDRPDSPVSSPEIDSKVAHLKATVQEALQSLRKDLDELEEDLVHATSAERVIEIARAVRATKKALDARSHDA